jgi:hypothetical protein
MYTTAYNMLLANKNFCLEETMAFINGHTQTQTLGFEGFPQTVPSVDFCRRDIKIVINAYLEGLELDNNERMIFVGSRYWKGDKSALVGNKQKEITAHHFLRDLIVNYVFKNLQYTSQQAIALQVITTQEVEQVAVTKIYNDCQLLIESIVDGPKKEYLHNHLEKRFTAKWWDPIEVETDKLETILECAYQAPSKQGHHDFEIHVLTDSTEGKEFKDYLFWENTACLNKVRAAPGPGPRRYNGQMLAPIVIVWLGKTQPATRNPYGESEWLRTNNDCIISATMAMCQAEELGVRTGFCGTLGGREIADRLNRPNHTAIISVGFGYATPDSLQVRKVIKDGVEMGFDLSNTDHTIRRSDNRKNRPSKYSMINYL